MNQFVLSGLDGSNPLAFLAACGVARLATLRWPQLSPVLHWQRRGVWVPVLSGVPSVTSEELCQELTQAPAAPIELFEVLGKNLTVAPNQFAEFVEKAEELAEKYPSGVDFAAAFGSEVCTDDKGDRIRYTDLCFITGSGHQDFLGTGKELQECVDHNKIHHCLFESIDDCDKGFSFRWSPGDARHYARRWKNPGPEGAWTNWGANRLAFEALPLFPTQPMEKRLKTTGFRRVKGQTEFTWPIWEMPLGIDEMRSLFSLGVLHGEGVDSEVVRGRGISEVFRSARVRIGKGANFKVSFLASRAV